MIELGLAVAGVAGLWVAWSLGRLHERERAERSGIDEWRRQRDALERRR